MKIASISGVTYYVKDINETAAFYGSLGFRLGDQDEKSLTVYVNWFWIRFQQVADVPKVIMDRGTYLNLKVVDVDEFYTDLIEQGVKSLSEPKETSWGSREFKVQDPDGYVLAFFQKK